MNFLPIFLGIKGKLCLVVGAGEVAHRKTSMLLAAGAIVKVVAPQRSDKFAGLADSVYVAERFRPEH